MTLRAELTMKLKEAMKSKNDLAKNLLRVILGEADTEEGRGKAVTDEIILRIIRKIAEGNL